MSYSCNTPVLMIFFNRPDTFEKVFEKVREAKPKTLILAQDGPRNDDDVASIEACRKIAENIDWDCNVIHDYSEVNLGCGVRPQSAITGALEKFESVIILEDDCIPSNSFFPYCEELLERYKDDERIAYISGLNHFEEWDCGKSDYFFTKAGAIWGWATWRRAWNRHYDYYVQTIQDEYVLKLYKQQVADKTVFENRLSSLKKAFDSFSNKEKLSYWDTQWGFAQYTQNMMAIVPKVNLIHNIGIGITSTHAKTLKNAQFVKYRNFVFIPTHELKFPINHPQFCAPDMEYHKLIYKCSRGTPIKRTIKKFINLILKLKNSKHKGDS